MRAEFYDIYEELSSSYCQEVVDWKRPDNTWERGLADVIRTMIGDVARDVTLEERLRPDAKYFLLINMHQMILLPLLHSQNKRRPAGEALLGIIRRDLSTILLAAAAEGGNESKISGGAVLRAVSKLWDTLGVHGKLWWKWKPRRLWG